MLWQDAESEGSGGDRVVVVVLPSCHRSGRLALLDSLVVVLMTVFPRTELVLSVVGKMTADREIRYPIHDTPFLKGGPDRRILPYTLHSVISIAHLDTNVKAKKRPIFQAKTGLCLRPLPRRPFS